MIPTTEVKKLKVKLDERRSSHYRGNRGKHKQPSTTLLSSPPQNAPTWAIARSSQPQDSPSTPNNSTFEHSSIDSTTCTLSSTSNTSHQDSTDTSSLTVQGEPLSASTPTSLSLSRAPDPANMPIAASRRLPPRRVRAERAHLRFLASDSESDQENE